MKLNQLSLCHCHPKNKLFSPDIAAFRSLIRIFAVPRRYSALAVKNIQASLIFLARFLVSLSDEL